jgi:hypothetical protein
MGRGAGRRVTSERKEIRMGKIQKRISPCLLKGPHTAAIKTAFRYIETGDPTVLAQVKKPTGWDSWRSEVGKAMDSPSRMDEEDR